MSNSNSSAASSRGASNSEINTPLRAAEIGTPPGTTEIGTPPGTTEIGTSPGTTEIGTSPGTTAIDSHLANADLTMLEMPPAIDDIEGRYSAPLNRAGPVRALRDPTSLADQLSISTQEARNSGIILAPCQYTPKSIQSEEDYGDSDDDE